MAKKRKKRGYITTPLTQRQLAQLAGRLTNDQLAPDQRALDEGYQAQSQAMTGFNAALADKLTGIGAGTEQAYTNAASTTSSLSKGFSDGLRMIAEQSGQGGAADVLYGTSGYIPGSTLAREGAAFGAQARAIPGIAARQGQQDLASAGAQYQNALKELARKRPEVYRQILQQLTQEETNKQGLALNAQALGLDYLKEQNDVSQFDDRANQPDSDLSRVYGYIVDSEGNPILDGRGDRQPVKGGSKPGKGKKSKAWDKWRSTAFTRARQLAKPVQAPNPAYDPANPLSGEEFIKKPPDYQKTFRKLWAEVAPPLRRAGWSQAKIRTMVKNALAAAGLGAGPPSASDPYGGNT